MRAIEMIAMGAIIFGATASSSFAADVNIVHGINGRDLGLAQSLPVDIAVNGACALKGVTFKQSTKVSLPPAAYTITVHLADGSCSQPPVISKQVTIPDSPGALVFSAVANLSKSGTPQLSVFSVSDLLIPSSVAVRHLAKAGAVTVKFSGKEIGRSQSSRITNGKQAILSVLTNRLPYTANIYPGASRRSIARLTGVGRKKFTIYNIVGSATNGFTIISEQLSPGN
jgi:hypothetical protein